MNPCVGARHPSANSIIQVCRYVTIRFPIAAGALPKRSLLKLLLELTCRWADYVHNPDSGKAEWEDCAVGIAIEVSLALWIMIGCLAMEAVQLAQYFD